MAFLASFLHKYCIYLLLYYTITDAVKEIKTLLIIMLVDNFSKMLNILQLSVHCTAIADVYFHV